MIIATAITLFCIGTYGLLAKRDILRLLISVMLLLSSATLLALAAGTAAGQGMILLLWAIETVEVIIGIALFLRLGTDAGDVRALRRLRW